MPDYRLVSWLTFVSMTPYNVQPKASATKSKKPASAPYGTKVAKKTAQNPLFEARPKTFGIGGDIAPKQDLTRFVKWPEYVRFQRQKVILHQRLKVSKEVLFDDCSRV